MTDTAKLEEIADFEIRRRFQILADRSTDGYVLCIFVANKFEITLTHDGHELHTVSETPLGALNQMFEQIEKTAV